MEPKTQLLLRLPADLKARLRQQATVNNRTLTGEITSILSSALTASSDRKN